MPALVAENSYFDKTGLLGRRPGGRDYPRGGSPLPAAFARVVANAALENVSQSAQDRLVRTVGRRDDALQLHFIGLIREFPNQASGQDAARQLTPQSLGDEIASKVPPDRFYRSACDFGVGTGVNNLAIDHHASPCR